jgi:hypothetical protein
MRLPRHPGVNGVTWSSPAHKAPFVQSTATCLYTTLTLAVAARPFHATLIATPRLPLVLSAQCPHILTPRFDPLGWPVVEVLVTVVQPLLSVYNDSILLAQMQIPLRNVSKCTE